MSSGMVRSSGAGSGLVAPISSASNTPVGITIKVPQAGHFAFLPAAVSGAESNLPHDAQFMLMGTVISF